MTKIPVVIILGPTAVGKTELTIEIAKNINGEIISADSMQIYKYMDIGTAKPDVKDRQGVKHHLLDIVYPNEDFNVSIYRNLAIKKIKEIHKKHKTPLISGGTGLYINSIIHSLDFAETGKDVKFRKELSIQVAQRGQDWLYNQVKSVDPESAARLHPNDTRRLIRALEVYHASGKLISEQLANNQENSLFSFTTIGLTMDRQKLYNRINKRVDIMLQNGLIDEVRWLIKNGYGGHLNSMQGLGYKEIIYYLTGRRTLVESTYILKRDTRRFAKRQLTWFKRLANVDWIDVGEYFDITRIIEDITHCITKRNPDIHE